MRFHVTLPIRIHTPSGEIQGQTRNISLLGVSAVTSQPAVPNTDIQAELDIPSGGPPIRVEGTVIRSTPLDLPGDSRYEVGLFAMRFPGDDAARLISYLEQLQTEEAAVIKAGYKSMRLKIRQRLARKRALLLARRRRAARRRARLMRRLAQAAARSRAKATARSSARRS